MKDFRRGIALILTSLMLLGLTACSLPKPPTQKDRIVTLVQGNLDEIYLGKTSDAYLRMVDSTAEQAQANYQEGIEAEAKYFCGYFDVESPSDELMAELIDLYKEIYSHSRYTVGEATKVDDKTYSVAVDVEPINIMELAIDSHEEALADFYEKYADADTEAMTDEEYQAYDNDWFRAVLDMVKAQLPNLGYQDPVTVDMRVTLGEDDVWQINDEDWQELDTEIICYP